MMIIVMYIRIQIYVYRDIFHMYKKVEGDVTRPIVRRVTKAYNPSPRVPKYEIKGGGNKRGVGGGLYIQEGEM